MSITSKKEGTEPVVIALILGIVMVGGLAFAVNGKASPDLIKLFLEVRLGHLGSSLGVPLHEDKAGVT